MGVDSEGGRNPLDPWIFIHETDIVDRGLIVLFFGLFSVGLPGNFSADALDTECLTIIDYLSD